MVMRIVLWQGLQRLGDGHAPSRFPLSTPSLSAFHTPLQIIYPVLLAPTQDIAHETSSAAIHHDVGCFTLPTHHYPTSTIIMMIHFQASTLTVNLPSYSQTPFSPSSS